MNNDEDKRSTDEQTQPENERKSASFSTTHDLRKHAEEALRMLRGTQQHDGDYSASQQQTSADKTAQHTSRAIDAGLAGDQQPFDEQTLLRIDVLDAIEPLIVDIRGEIVVGRGDTVTSYMPDVDLAPHGAYRLGLSRKHAILQRQGDALHIIDLGSRNGTHINGAVIEPKRPHPVQNGDEVQFGDLVVRFFFQARGKAAQ